MSKPGSGTPTGTQQREDLVRGGNTGTGDGELVRERRRSFGVILVGARSLGVILVGARQKLRQRPGTVVDRAQLGQGQLVHQHPGDRPVDRRGPVWPAPQRAGSRFTTTAAR